MAFSAYWTHGNAVVAETPNQLTKFVRLGFGTEVQLQRGTSHWFHVPMPTPVVVNGVRPKLRRVIILGQSDVSSCVRRVHIFDGSSRLQDHATLICGNNTEFNERAVVDTGVVPIMKGLGISMFIESQTFSASYLFAAFGADWE